jgi:hypothetical protein
VKYKSLPNGFYFLEWQFLLTIRRTTRRKQQFKLVYE